MKEYINCMRQLLRGEGVSAGGYTLYEGETSEVDSNEDVSDDDVNQPREDVANTPGENSDGASPVVRARKYDHSDRISFMVACVVCVIIQGVCKATDRMDIILLGLHSFVNTTGSDLFFEPRVFAPFPYEENTTQPCEELNDQFVEIAESESIVDCSLAILTALFYLLADVTSKSSCYKYSSKIFTLTCFTGALTFVIMVADFITPQKTSDKHHESNDVSDNSGLCSANILSDWWAWHTQNRLAAMAILQAAALINAAYPFLKKLRDAAEVQEARAASELFQIV